MESVVETLEELQQNELFIGDISIDTILFRNNYCKLTPLSRILSNQLTGFKGKSFYKQDMKNLGLAILKAACLDLKATKLHENMDKLCKRYGIQFLKFIDDLL